MKVRVELDSVAVKPNLRKSECGWLLVSLLCSCVSFDTAPGGKGAGGWMGQC